MARNCWALGSASSDLPAMASSWQAASMDTSLSVVNCDGDRVSRRSGRTRCELGRVGRGGNSYFVRLIVDVG